jgi:hypothetical protein
MTATRTPHDAQVAYLRDLAEKRDAAFGTDLDHDLRARCQEWNATHRPPYRPIRANTPRAGDVGYEAEWHAPHISRRAWLAIAIVCFMGACAWIWALAWAVEWIVRTR